MVSITEKYSYNVFWSNKDGEYVGICQEFPSVSWLSPSAGDSYDGIRQIIEDIVEDMIGNGETLPLPIFK